MHKSKWWQKDRISDRVDKSWMKLEITKRFDYEVSGFKWLDDWGHKLFRALNTSWYQFSNLWASRNGYELFFITKKLPFVLSIEMTFHKYVSQYWKKNSLAANVILLTCVLLILFLTFHDKGKNILDFTTITVGWGNFKQDFK